MTDLRPRRLVFLGTPRAAVPPLRALHAAGFDLALVVSRADTRRGRGSEPSPSPVKAAAVELGIPVTSEIDEVGEVGADLGVVVAYGRIIRPEVLARVPMVNLHFSLLPRWRGAAPVERALLAGDSETGVCVMEVAEGLDTGGVHAREVVPIATTDTAATLTERLVDVGTRLLVDTLVEARERGMGRAEPQVGDPTYAEKITAADLEIDWSAPAAVTERQVRVGGAFTRHRGRRLKVWQVRLVDAAAGPPSPGELAGTMVGTGSNPIELVEVQPEGKARQEATAWVRGARLEPGERLGA